MKYSIAAGFGKLVSTFITNGKKYGVEWWILVVGALIILAIILMAIFAGSIAPFDPSRSGGRPTTGPSGRKTFFRHG